MRFVWIGILLVCQLVAAPVETFYGTLEVEEPVLLELIASPPMQRLKQLYQYGIARYLKHPEEYNRYDHSLGVFAILRLKGASLEEQIAGLLHDVSHTVFSHVGDYLFEMHLAKDSYQDSIHEWYLTHYGIGQILEKHGFSIQGVLPKTGIFSLLEQDLPDLCADRIDYNLQGAFYQGFLTKEEILEWLQEAFFDGQKWVAKRADLTRKMADFALFMTQDCWGSADNYFTSQWLCAALRRGLEIDLLTMDEIHGGTDDVVWHKLQEANDPIICQEMARIAKVDQHYRLDSDAPDFRLPMKFRGIDPWLQVGEQTIRLSEWDSGYVQAYQQVKKKMKEGWPIKEIYREAEEQDRLKPAG